ncbi:conserved hypothetical protein [Desulfamplus magnetovallimortis]|uniref:Uncharacterized protein n=1 Tax=Desulfamplus magnetovallimortis TaxID=1246637 RepID=A0A1W1H980_9BACT|nr:hypothetical protein [Desulfamplus magnetovallimortis]SLM28994.1 conserved hypothetical protein [Desulfamplus magnetovallimortis]
MNKKIKYILENWKMILHLLFRTKRFGVNNMEWSQQDSLFGQSWIIGFAGLLKNYKMMKIRAFSGFIPLNDAIALFPEHARRNGYHAIKPPLTKP